MLNIQTSSLLLVVSFRCTLVLKEFLVHQCIVLAHHLQNLFLARFHNVSPDDHLFQDKVCLVKVKDQVQLANVPEILV